jgi:hypothetical protein
MMSAKFHMQEQITVTAVIAVDQSARIRYRLSLMHKS